MKRVKSVNSHSLCVLPTFIIGTYNENINYDRARRGYFITKIYYNEYFLQF